MTEASAAMSRIVDLNGRVALVTGGGRGVGRQIALHLAAHNAGGVIVNDYVESRAAGVVEEIKSLGGNAVAVAGDVTSRQGAAEMVARGADALGRVDILVNNAGNKGAAPAEDIDLPFWEASQAAWESYVAVNFTGVINCASAVIPGMIARSGGRIITIISDAGRVGEPGLELYSAAKAGAAGFMRAAARTLGRYGITANTVAIAATVTPGVEDQLNALTPEKTKRMLERYVIRRFGQPEDIANMVTFLAAEANGWITGQTYPVNGGFSFSL